MKSSWPASAHWRSSNRRPTVPVDASRSKKVRHARKSSSRPPAGASPTPSSASIDGSIQARSPSSGTCVGEHLRDLRPGRLRVVRLEEAGARPDHLAERPERDPLAVGRRAAVVPPDAFDHAVDVLEELPRQPALADPGLAGDRDEPGALLAGGGVEEVLEEAQLLVATDERRLEPVAPAEALALADDAEGQPGGHRQLLALQDLVGDGLEGDRAGRGSLGRVADEDRAGRGRGLEPRGGVDEVAGHHPLVARADRHRGLAGQHAGAGLDARPEVTDGLDQLEGGANGPLGVVLVGHRRAPDGHHRVADELLDGAAVAIDDLAGHVEVAGQQLPDGFGVAAFG